MPVRIGDVRSRHALLISAIFKIVAAVCVFLVVSILSPGNAQQIDSFEQVELLRLEGSLDAAQAMAEKLLVAEQAPFQQLQLHLELARRIEDIH